MGHVLKCLASNQKSTLHLQGGAQPSILVHHLVDHIIVIPLAVTNLLHDHIQKREDDVKENETHHLIIHQ
ncbi:hypothetical protein ACJX0J_034553, partial [Zea mays]